MVLCTRALLLGFLGLFVVGCSSDDERDGVEYIQTYIDTNIGFDYQELPEKIESQKQELLRYAAIASRVNRDMDAILGRADSLDDQAELKAYVEGLSGEERRAPKEMTRVAGEMRQSMTRAFEAFSVQMAVMTVTEEVCGKSGAAEKWQDLFLRVKSELKGKFSDRAITDVEDAHLSTLDRVATDYENGAYRPSCSSQMEHTRFMEFAELVLEDI